MTSSALLAPDFNAGTAALPVSGCIRLFGRVLFPFMSLPKEIAPDASGVISISITVKSREKPLLSIHDSM